MDREFLQLAQHAWIQHLNGLEHPGRIPSGLAFLLQNTRNGTKDCIPLLPGRLMPWEVTLTYCPFGDIAGNCTAAGHRGGITRELSGPQMWAPQGPLLALAEPSCLICSGNAAGPSV